MTMMIYALAVVLRFITHNKTAQKVIYVHTFSLTFFILAKKKIRAKKTSQKHFNGHIML
jgi:hypothetical protein